MLRTIIPHCNMDSVAIDSFQCDHCCWSFPVAQTTSFVISHEETARACAAFDEHRCENFGPRRLPDAAARCRTAA